MSADEFRAALERLDLTQVEAATLIGRHEQEVSQWARGVRAVPDYIARLVILIEAAGVKKARKLLK
jgi:DNA-binding transcriptional regulator YdaS (Cro superfamily)